MFRLSLQEAKVSRLCSWTVMTAGLLFMDCDESRSMFRLSLQEAKSSRFCLWTVMTAGLCLDCLCRKQKVADFVYTL